MTRPIFIAALFAALFVASVLAILTNAESAGTFFPEKAEEVYYIHPLGPNTNEHIRTLRRGRYITLCYWVATADAKEKVYFHHCETKTEFFGGH